MRWRGAMLGVVLLVGCGGSTALSVSRVDEIKGGFVDDGGLPSVFMVRSKYDNGQQSLCTGTLITPRTILTAAHCLEPSSGPPGATALTEVFVTNASPDPGSSSALWLRVEPMRTRFHPSYVSSNPQLNDIALVVLPTASMVRPTPILSRALSSADVGMPLLVAGYGVTSFSATDSKTRRAVQLPLRGLTATHVQIGDQSTKGICNGDSGGPSFLRGRDGTLRVIGVHSYDVSRPNCDDGLDTRVDLFLPFIQQFIRDEEGGASCFEDGQCAMGCASPDVDCVCGADSSCNAQCPNLLTDPDCPADCVANGVCATQDCPRRDPDCTAELGACTMASQCQHRVCVMDAQHVGSYCSRPCSATCGVGTECSGGNCIRAQLPTATAGANCTQGATFCLDATVCTGFTGAPTTCVRPCATNAACPQSECVTGANNFMFCRPTSMPGAVCEPATTLCLNATTCAAFAGELPVCREPCMTDSSCAPGRHCEPTPAGVKVCRIDAVTNPLLATESLPAGKSGCTSAPFSWALGALLLRRRLGRPCFHHSSEGERIRPV